MLTTLGLCFGVTTGVMLVLRAVPFALLYGLLSVFCDVFDGTLARRFGMETKFGRVYDSVADRVSETAVVVGALACGIIQPLGLVAVAGSTSLFLLRALSYTRRQNTDYVLFGRVERLFCILVGLVSPFVALSTFCFVLAGAFGFVSSLQISVFLLRRRS